MAEAAAGADGFLRPLGVPVRAEAYYPLLVSLSGAIQVVALPAFAALADGTGRWRELLAVTAYTGSGATLALWFVTEDAALLGGGLFLVASVAFACSVVVANAFLPGLAGPEERDAVSSRGWALGYLGGGLLLAAHLALFTSADALGLAESTAVRVCLLSAGVWWGLFSLVPVLGLRGAGPPAGARPGEPRGLRRLLATARELRRARMTLVFLAAYLLYNDGVQTVVSQASVFADRALGHGQGLIAAAVLLVQFVAVFGALALGRLAGRFGAKRVVLASLGLWTGVLGYAFVLPAESVAPFLVLAALIGLVLGGTQALSRSLFSHLVPRGREAEYFSIYEIAERGTSWLGALLFGLAVQLTGDYRVAILSLLAFFALGFVGLAACDVRRAAAEAGNRAPARL